jgi:hypothetical protein
VAVPTVLQPYLKTDVLEATEAVRPFGVIDSGVVAGVVNV